MPASARVAAPQTTGVRWTADSRSGMAIGLGGDQFSHRIDLPQSGAIPRAEDTKFLAGTQVPFARGNLIYAEGDSAEYLYLIVSGMARGYKVTAEGRRQIVAFYVPGDLFGFERGVDHTISTEAINDLKVRMIKRAGIFEYAAQDQTVARQLWDALARSRDRDQEHILRLGQTARVRVASFLLELSQRAPNAGLDGIPMSRQDIADYLDLTIETVSRTLTLLKSTKAIAISSTRKITTRNLGILQRQSSET